VATTVALPRTSDGTLTLDELAVLLITSPAHIRPQREGETVIITTKDAYIWAVFFSELVGREGEPERFLNEIREFLNEYGRVFRLMYDTLGVGPEDAADSMLSFMAHKYGLESKAIVERANAAYLSLVQKSLIEDPFKKKVAAFLICMAGLFPQNVTSTTDKGGATVQTYHSRALDFEHRKDAEAESYKVDIKLVQIVREVYPKLIEIFDDVVGPPSDRNAEPPQKQ